MTITQIDARLATLATLVSEAGDTIRQWNESRLYPGTESLGVAAEAARIVAHNGWAEITRLQEERRRFFVFVSLTYSPGGFSASANHWSVGSWSGFGFWSNGQTEQVALNVNVYGDKGGKVVEDPDHGDPCSRRRAYPNGDQEASAHIEAQGRFPVATIKWVTA